MAPIILVMQTKLITLVTLKTFITLPILIEMKITKIIWTSATPNPTILYTTYTHNTVISPNTHKTNITHITGNNHNTNTHSTYSTHNTHNTNYERLVLAPRFFFFRSSYFVLGSPFLNSLKIYILY